MIWRAAGEARKRTVPATLSVLRRSGPPYQLTTRQLTERTLATAAGHELVERLVDCVLGREAELISRLSPHQRATLTELLLRLLLADLQTQLGNERPSQVGSTWLPRPPHQPLDASR